MRIILVLGYLSFGLSAVLMIIAIGEQNALFFMGALSFSISGVLFLALDKIITTLIEIRDAVRGGAVSVVSESLPTEESSKTVAINANSSSNPDTNAPSKTLSELSKAIDEMKRNIAD